MHVLFGMKKTYLTFPLELYTISLEQDKDLAKI